MRRWWECRGRRYKVGGKRIRGLKARIECKCCISRRGPDWAVEIYQLKKFEKEVTVLLGVESPKKAGVQQGGQLQEWQLPRVLNLEKESSEHFKYTQLEHVQHCTDLLRQVTFQHTLNRERRDKGWDERCRLSGEGEEGQEKGRRRQADFKETACYPSAVVQGATRRKNGLCEGSAQGSWDPWKGQQPFQPNPNGVGDRTTTMRQLLIGAVQFCMLYM